MGQSTRAGLPETAARAWCRHARHRRRHNRSDCWVRVGMPVEGPALHVDDGDRDLGEVGQADELRHQRDTRARCGREGARAVPARAHHHADRGQSSSACTMAKLCCGRYPGPRGTCRSISGKPQGTDDDGVIGYQAATVAPPYTQPSAAALLPSVKIWSPPCRNGAPASQSQKGQVLADVVAPQVQRLDVRIQQRSLPLYCSANRTFQHTGIHIEQHRQGAHVDDVLEQLALAWVGVGGVADLGQRHGDGVMSARNLFGGKGRVLS